jgi:hypothetical protein
VDLNVYPFIYIQTFLSNKNHGVLTMKKISLALIILIIVGICIPAVSAEELYDSGESSANFNIGASAGTSSVTSYFKVYRIEDWPALTFLYFRVDDYADAAILNANPSYSMPVTFYKRQTQTVLGHGTAYYNGLKNSAGTYTGAQCWVEIDDWDIGTLTGTQLVDVTPQSGTLFNGMKFRTSNSIEVSSSQPIGFYLSYNAKLSSGMHMARNSYEWKNSIIVTDEAVELTRQFDDRVYSSTLQVVSDIGTVSDTSTLNIDLQYLGSGNWTVTNPYNKVFTGTLSKSSGSTNAITVYVRNSQTNALIADSHIVISASVNNNFHEVINQTLSSGTYTGDLQPTGGGMPNPDFYRLIVTAEGYNSILPYFDFELDRVTKIYAYLDPTGGAPEDENNTFIDFYVRDMSANPISGATVNFGGYTLITNSAGYTIFEVAKNKTYSWTVSKSGYGSLTGNAVIGSNGRHTINTVLAPAVTPTIPTAIPTSTPISSTPTMTAPTGEPVSNWLEWFAAHFGMILGGGVEIGKIFMWLCFAVPVGVYVGKEAKAGAAGFMAGAGIVTLFFVLIGWVPIWLLVLLALVIGLLYAKVFNNSDTGGGR